MGEQQTFVTEYEFMVEAAKELLERTLAACKADGVVGSRGVGHTIALTLYKHATTLVSVLKRLGETRNNQLRLWVAYVAFNNYNNDKTKRTGEAGFARLPPLI